MIASLALSPGEAALHAVFDESPGVYSKPWGLFMSFSASRPRLTQIRPCGINEKGSLSVFFEGAGIILPRIHGEYRSDIPSKARKKGCVNATDLTSVPVGRNVVTRRYDTMKGVQDDTGLPSLLPDCVTA